MFKKCDNCGKKLWEETVKHLGHVYFLCEKCYDKLVYPIRTK